MVKALGNVRPDRAGPQGVEFLEGRALLSGLTHAAAAAAQQAVNARPMLAIAQPTTTVAPRVKTVTPSMLAGAPPMLEKSHLLRNGNTVTGLVMTFSKPLDPATAQDLQNYDVSPLTRAAGDGTVSAAVYNPGQDSVTLILAQPVTLKRGSRGVLFEVNNPYSNDESASTITDTSGQALQSTGDGQPDGRLYAQFKARGSSPNPLSIASRLARARAAQSKYANLGDSISGGFHNAVDRLTGAIFPD
jgi:hypothetical protein